MGIFEYCLGKMVMLLMRRFGMQGVTAFVAGILAKTPFVSSAAGRLCCDDTNWVYKQKNRMVDAHQTQSQIFHTEHMWNATKTQEKTRAMMLTWHWKGSRRQESAA